MVGNHYRTQLKVKGGASPYQWEVVGPNALPAGLALDAETGTISGVPSQHGNFHLTVKVTDKSHAAAQRDFNLSIWPRKAEEANWFPNGRRRGHVILSWPQNHLCWAKQYESALRDEFRLVACDLRGHGMSETPPEAQHYTDGELWAAEQDHRPDIAQTAGRGRSGGHHRGGVHGFPGAPKSFMRRAGGGALGCRSGTGW
jgi:hypothetical protein